MFHYSCFNSNQLIYEWKISRYYMGDFYGLIVCVIYHDNDHPVAETNVISFSEKEYVTWQSLKPAETGWISRGINSIHFKKGATIQREIAYEQEAIITPVTIGTFRKRKEFKVSASYGPFWEEAVVCQIVLPQLCVPLTPTFHDKRPQHIKKINNFLALTWTFGPAIDGGGKKTIKIEFSYRKTSEDEFQKFKAEGEPINMRFSPEVKAQLEKSMKIMKDQGAPVAATVVGELVKGGLSN